MIYGCFLSYYSEYFESALNEFLVTLSLNSEPYCCIIIDNGKLSKIHIELADSLGCKVTPGDNRLGEFSGWQRALDYIKFSEEFTLKVSDNFVFANDTFNQHRKWTIKNRIAAIAGLMESRKHPSVPLLVGHVDQNNMSFSLNDLSCDAWVSTFIFITNYTFLNQLDWKLALTNKELEGYYGGVSNSGIEWKSTISNSLQVHINQWLFPISNSVHCWYGAFTKTPVQKKFKLASILNEKYLSAQCLHQGGSLISWRTKKEYVSLIVKNYQSILRAIK